MARTMPSLLEIATSDARGPERFGSQALIAFVGRLLKPRVDRGLDAQAALERALRALLPAAELVDHLLLDPGREVRVVRVLLREGQEIARRQTLGLRLVVQRPRQVPLLEQPQQDEVAPLLGRDRMLHRVIRGRRRDHAGQQGCLVREQHGRARRLVLRAALVVVVLEVRARGRLDPIGAVAVVDRVQVVAKDLLLRPPAIEVVGERRLAQLLEDRALVLRGKRNLYELLRDRRGALDGLLLLDVLDGRARDAADVDAVVGVEAAVLDRDDRVLHHRCDFVFAQVDPALVPRQRADLVPRVSSSTEGRAGRSNPSIGGRSERRP